MRSLRCSCVPQGDEPAAQGGAGAVRRAVGSASKGGDDRDPDWYRNVVANPDVELTAKGTTRPMRARTATTDERAELWPRIVKVSRGYAGYQERTDREIPVVILESR